MALIEPGIALRDDKSAQRHGVLLLTFISSIFTSAFLLFAVQPMFSKMVLPLLGGSPGVWSVAMVVFQTLLLAGYGYAHLSTRYLTLKTSALVHLALYCGAAITLPLAVNTSLGEAPASGQELWLAGVFLLSVGLPFFAVSANGPLLQNWFSRSSHPTAHDPYYLYGASNLGSFASLILYPVVIEPLLTLKVQTQSWAIGFGILGLLLGLCGWLVAVNPGAARAADAATPTEAAPSRRIVLGWIALAFVPSGLLVAVTAHLSTDVAAAPFLWVIPLALYLASFVVMFRDKPPITMDALSILTLLLGVIAAHSTIYPPENLSLAVAIHLAFLAMVTFLCHGRMYEQRPGTEYLTTFYLWMSFGGVLGGAFCGLVAPALFNKLHEYPLLTIAAMACVPAIYTASWREIALKSIPFAGIALAIGAVMVADRGLISGMGMQYLFTALLLVGLACYRKPLIAMGACMAIVILGAFGIKEEVSHRSFFGVHRIFNGDDGLYRKLAHGTTIHDSILIRNADGSPLPAKPEATAYYHAKAPLAEALRTIQNRDAQPRHFGVVGLGAGAIVCNGREQDRWTYYEIDAAVAQIATDPSQFRFLSACAPSTDIVMGDARLTIAREQRQFDALVIDAFSSDAIPVHLLTREALAMYLKRIGPDGMVVLHVSNRHMELESVLAAIARDLGIHGMRKFFVTQDSDAINSSRVVALAPNKAALATLEAQGWTTLNDTGTTAWTDDYSNIIGAIWRHYHR